MTRHADLGIIKASKPATNGMLPLGGFAMTIAEWVTSFLMLPTVLVPALPPQPKSGWTGETVLVRKSGTPYTPKENASPEAATQHLRSIEYRVREDKDGKLLLFEQGGEVWVNKEDMV